MADDAYVPNFLTAPDAENLRQQPEIVIHPRPRVPPPVEQSGSGAEPRTTRMGATYQGFKGGASFKLNDEIAGVMGASGLDLPDSPGATSIKTLVGLARLGYESLIGGGDNVAAEYRKARDADRAYTAAAHEEHPYLTGGGELLGAAAIPIPGAVAAKGAGLGERVIRGMVTAGGSGALTGVGAGETPAERTVGGVVGGVVGTAVGGAVPVATTVVPGAAKYIGQKTGISEIWPTIKSMTEASREKMATQAVGGALRADLEGKGGGLTMPQAIEGRNAGQPVVAADLGGENVRGLARYVHDISDEARNIVTEGFAKPRFAGQGTRTGQFVDDLMGGNVNSTVQREALKAEARAANKPAYQRLYSDNNKGIWSDELERLTGSKAVVNAMRSAEENWKDTVIRDKFGAMNPGVKVTPDGRIEFASGKTGVPAYPDMQFWDYTLREMRAAARTETNTEARSRMGGLADQLRDEIDRLVPAYKEVRGTAASYFKSEDALDAGKKFAEMTSRMNERELRPVFDKMTDPEKKLFADGFADSIITNIRRMGYNSDIVKRIWNSDESKARIRLALGDEKSKQLESYLYRETIMDKLRQALGNSQTSRFMAKHQQAAIWGAGVAGADAYLSGDLDKTQLIKAAVFGALAEGKMAVNRNLANRIAMKLVSEDPKEWQTAIKIAANSRQGRAILQGIDSSLERMIGQVAGSKAGQPEKNNPNK